MIKLLLATLPVLLFLLALIYLDSYKLVGLRSVVGAVCAGILAAAGGYWINRALLASLALSVPSYSRYGAPFVEEFLKAGVLFYMIRTKRVGVLVEAAI